MVGNTKGGTLLEALVGAFILQLILLATASLFVQAVRYNAAAADMGTVLAAAVERMESIRGTEDADLVPGGSLIEDVTADGVHYFDASDPRYVVRWRISEGAVAEGGKRVSVRALALRQVTGRPKDVVLNTIRGAQ